MVLKTGSTILASGQLQTDKLEEICQRQNYGIELRKHADYDHSYYFIASFIEDHLRFHQSFLKGS
ncbi:MAG: hypothetical protein HRU09_03620 [Oligoflexales bacterium]|nr:hypothetical protein [Oligoflexales bacterium]